MLDYITGFNRLCGMLSALKLSKFPHCDSRIKKYYDKILSVVDLPLLFLDKSVLYYSGWRQVGFAIFRH